MRFPVLSALLIFLSGASLSAAIYHSEVTVVPATKEVAETPISTTTFNQSQALSFREKITLSVRKKKAKRAARRAARKGNKEQKHGLVRVGFWLSLGGVIALLTGAVFVAPLFAIAGGVIGAITRGRYAKKTKYRKMANVAFFIGIIGIIGGGLILMVSASLSNWANAVGGG